MITEEKKQVYLKDKIVNILLTDKDTRCYTEAIIANALDIPIEIVKDNLELVTPRINNNVNTEYSIVDAQYENQTSIINIEVNYRNTAIGRNRSMDFLKKLSYTEIKKGNSLEKLLYILICEDKSELDKLYVGDGIMEKVRDKMETLTEDFDNDLYYNLEEFQEAETYELGMKDKAVEMAKKLLKDNITLDKIIEYTELPKEDVEEIINESNHE